MSSRLLPSFLFRSLPCSERSGYSVREELPLPSAPPYTAHLANLSFDASDEDVQDFFRDCELKEVRIVRDKMDDKPKGFGYVTFETLEGLKTALNLSNGSLAGRSVRVSVAEPRTYCPVFVWYRTDPNQPKVSTLHVT